MWVPKHKYELVDALSTVPGFNRSNLSKLNKKQLYAIFFRLRKEKGMFT